MKGGEKGLIKDDRVEVVFNGGILREGKVEAFSEKGKEYLYSIIFDDGYKKELWIPEARVSKVVNPPVPTAEGQGRRRKTRSKRSKRRKTHRR